MRDRVIMGTVLATWSLAAPPASAQVCDGISTVSGAELTTVRIASSLNRPVFVGSPPGDTERLFILEQNGPIRIVRNGTLLYEPFLDLSDLVYGPDEGGQSEQGLLGLAFHPNYAVNGTLFVYTTADVAGNNMVVRYQRDPGNPDRGDPASRQVLITIPHPDFGNHDGGTIAFGPDGYLYIASGDGGSGCDPQGNAQSGASLLGKILRLDVDTSPYAVPPDNPFAGPDGFADEVWAYGLRNPWRIAFDPANGDLYIPDVGQNEREEIDYQPASSPGGENYGWDLYEGLSCPNPSCGSVTCAIPAYVPPVFEYSHDAGACSITGGVVYRGCRMPDLHGRYFFADYCSAQVTSFVMAGGAPTDLRDHSAELQPAAPFALGEIVAFGTDARGEMYVADLGGTVPVIQGEIYKVVPVLRALEASGPGAAAFLVDSPSGDDWSWEDLQATSSHPIVEYRVYRTDGGGSGVFACIHQQPGTMWAGGDPAVPAARGVFSYLVTALNAAGEETSPGAGSDGTPRTLLTDPCPP
jgi:glucose/arabinose dehydrogenase